VAVFSIGTVNRQIHAETKTDLSNLTKQKKNPTLLNTKLKKITQILLSLHEIFAFLFAVKLKFSAAYFFLFFPKK